MRGRLISPSSYISELSDPNEVDMTKYFLQLKNHKLKSINMSSIICQSIAKVILHICNDCQSEQEVADFCVFFRNSLSESDDIPVSYRFIQNISKS